MYSRFEYSKHPYTCQGQILLKSTVNQRNFRTCGYRIANILYKNNVLNFQLFAEAGMSGQVPAPFCLHGLLVDPAPAENRVQDSGVQGWLAIP